MIVAVIVLIIILAAAVEIVREVHCFKVTRYQVCSPKLAGLAGEKRLVFLSDLHNQVYGKDNSSLVEAVCKERPDYILIGGDMLVGKNGCDYTRTVALVKSLAGICPVYYAYGNHEQRLKEHPEKYDIRLAPYKEALKEAGVQFLENAFVQLQWGQVPVRIYGLEIPMRCYAHFRRPRLESEEIRRQIGTCTPSQYNILLAHAPGYMEQYLKWGADLILSGHLHGGLVRIPGIAGVIAPTLELFPKYSGDQYEEGEQTIVVSKGLGNHTVRIRLFNPAEVVSLSLRGTNTCEKKENPV